MSPNPEAQRPPDAIQDAIRGQRQLIEGRNIFKMTAEESQRFIKETEQLQKQLLDSIRDTEQKALNEEVSNTQSLNVGNMGRAALYVTGLSMLFSPSSDRETTRKILQSQQNTATAERMLFITPPGMASAAYSYFNRTQLEDYIDKRTKEVADKYGVRMDVLFAEGGNMRIRIEPLSDQRRQEADIFQTLRPGHPDRPQTMQRFTVDAQLSVSELAGLLRNNQRLDSPAVVGILASMRSALQNIERVDPGFRAGLFQQMTRWLVDAGTGYSFGSDQLALINNQVPSAPRGPGNIDPAALRNITDRLPPAMQKRLDEIENQLDSQTGPIAQIMQAIQTGNVRPEATEAARRSLLQSLQEIGNMDHALGTLVFQFINDKLAPTDYRLTTNPQFGLLNLENRVEHIQRAIPVAETMRYLRGGVMPPQFMETLNRFVNMDITLQEMQALQASVGRANLTQRDFTLIERVIGGIRLTGQDQRDFEQTQKRLRTQLNDRQGLILDRFPALSRI